MVRYCISPMDWSARSERIRSHRSDLGGKEVSLSEYKGNVLLVIGYDDPDVVPGGFLDGALLGLDTAWMRSMRSKGGP